MKSDKEPTIRKIYQPTDKEKEALSYIYRDRYEAMKTSKDRMDAEKMWDKAEKQYETWREARDSIGKESWQSNHVVPITFAAIETALSEMVDQNLLPLILGRGEEDVPRALVMKHAFDYTWEISDNDLVMYDIYKDTLMFGTAIGQEYYRKDRRIIREVRTSKGGKEEVVEKEVYDYDDVCTEVVKLQDFFVDENARGFKGCYAAKDCIRRYIMTMDAFKSYYSGPVWDPMNRAQYVRPGGDINYYEFYKPPSGIDTSKMVEVLWYWGKLPTDRLLIVANDVVIKDSPNPYKHKQLPFARSVDVKRVHRFYGKGEPECLESMQDESNTLRRMIIDRNHLDIDKMFLVSNKIPLNEEDLIARPHGMIPVEDTNTAKPIEYNDIPRSVELSLKHLEDDATIATGINPRSQSLPTAGSATEAAILKESTLKRVRLKMFLIRKQFITEIARLRVSNILQFYSQPKLEQIVGEEGTEDYRREVDKLKALGLYQEIAGKSYKAEYKKITVKDAKLSLDIKGKVQEQPARGYTFFDLKPEYFTPLSSQGFDIKFEVGTNIQISKALMQSKDLEMFDRVSQIALQVPNSYDIVKLTDMILRSYDKDPYMLKPQEVQQSDQEQQIGMQVDLAGMENKMLMQGKQVPATPYASPAHTRIHVEFMQSPDFQGVSNNSPIIQNFTDHVMGEIAAQQVREQGGVEGASGGGEGNAQMPQGGISQGITNRPGGMAQPSNKIADILPALQTGGNKNIQ